MRDAGFFFLHCISDLSDLISSTDLECCFKKSGSIIFLFAYVDKKG